MWPYPAQETDIAQEDFSVKKPKGKCKSINLALQGGGAHGAFTWGVLDKICEDGRLNIDGISAASAGAMNATVFSYGFMKDGRAGARKLLHDFWFDIGSASKMYSPLDATAWKAMFLGWENLDMSSSFYGFDAFTKMLSPYQFNPMGINPLRSILKKHVKFEEIREQCGIIKLFISATNVRSNRIKIFHCENMSVDAVMASACIPTVFQAVEVDGEHYWDGGYMGNPALYPLAYETETTDVLIVHINPVQREEVPRTPMQIFNRINEISFNSSLMRELRSLQFAKGLVDEGMIRPESLESYRFDKFYVHSLRAEEATGRLSVASKMSPDWTFLCHLRDQGRKFMQEWLDENFDQVGKGSSIDLTDEY